MSKKHGNSPRSLSTLIFLVSTKLPQFSRASRQNCRERQIDMKLKRPTDLSQRNKSSLLKGAVAALLSLCIALPIAVLPLSAAAAAEITTDTATEASYFTDSLNQAAENAPEITVIRPTASRVMEGSAVTPRISMTADTPVGRSRIYYPYPWGAMAVSLYLNGKRVLPGEVADIGGTVYVPVQRYADLFGNFKTTYEAATERVTISGTNLYITVQVGDPYITVNDRIFYTGSKVLSLGGWIFVPITAMSKALGATVYIKKGYYETYVTSGDPTSVAWDYLPPKSPKL